MKKHYLQYLFLACLLVISGCKKDAVNPGDDEPNLNNPILQLENERLDNVVPDATVFAFLQGYVEDEFGNPLADATVKVSGITKTTDVNGYFIFEGINVNESFAVVKATKENYHKNFRTFTPKANTVQTVKIQLLAKGISKNFNSNSGGNLEFESGKVKLDFPSKSIIKRDGSTYNGNVNVIARYMDPDSDNLMSIMPGMLTGLDEDDNVVGMISYGMVTVELTDNSGNMLEVNPDSKVEVKLPASVSGPVTIPLWHFNETYGLWIEAGTATKVGSEYVGEVNHFSTWNLDIDFNGEPINVKVTNQENIPIPHTAVEVYNETFEERYAQVYTDNNGEFTLLYASQDLGFKVITDCEAVEILPSLVGGNLIVVLDETDLENAIPYTLNITAKDCENVVYANKYVQLTSSAVNLNYFGQTNAQGQFSFSSLLCGINPSIPYQIDARIYLDASLGTVKDTTLAITFTGSEQEVDVNFCGIVEDTMTLTDSTAVFFADSNLEQAVREAINQPNGPLLYGSVKTLDNLSAAERAITNLQGIQYLSNLIQLRLWGNQISDISPLSGLINLEYLELLNNEISNISPLSGLTNLIFLELDGNEISDISPLSGLTNLETLSLSDNEIPNISPLSDLNNLKTLGLAQNKFSDSDISLLSGLINLEALNLSDNEISNISPLAGLTSLFLVDLSYNEISNISPLAGLTNLQQLVINNNQIINLNPLCDLSNIEELSIFIEENTPPFTSTQKSNLEACLPNATIYW
jgi:hypothetical protein